MDFMHHVIWMSVAKVTSVTAAQEVEDVCHSNRLVAAWIEKQRLESIKLTLRSQQAPQGRRKHTRNTGSSHCQADLPDLSFSVIWGRLLLIDWIPITINEPAVFVLLFTLRDLYLARVYSGISTKLNILPRLISQISLKAQNPESRIQDKRETYRALFE